MANIGKVFVAKAYFVSNDTIEMERRILREKLQYRVGAFLKKNEKNKVGSGIPFPTDSLEEALELLSHKRDGIDIGAFPEEYKLFLEMYGSIHSSHHHVCGTPPWIKEEDESLSSFVSDTQIFYANKVDMKDEEGEMIKSPWLVAMFGNFNDPFYCYFDLSREERRGRVYVKKAGGNCELFANNFFEFLTKFFKSIEEFHGSPGDSMPERQTPSAASGSARSTNSQTVVFSRSHSNPGVGAVSDPDAIPESDPEKEAEFWDRLFSEPIDWKLESK